MRHKQSSDHVRDRVAKDAERLALDQAKRVPWKRLLEGAEDYTEWQVFSLWLRAVVDAAQGIPAMVIRETNSRTPGFLDSLPPTLDVEFSRGVRAGSRIWQDVSLWAEVNIFVDAKRGGWLDAVRYFSSMSLRSMKAWSHWEDVDRRWRRTKPGDLPGLEQWRQQVDVVRRLSNPDSLAQQVLESVRRVPEPEWCRLYRCYSDLMAFCLWLELVLDVEGPTSEMVSAELDHRYNGFRAPRHARAKATIVALNKWAIAHVLKVDRDAGILAALGFHVRHHPEYAAMLRYAQHCHGPCHDLHPQSLPPFAQWRTAADAFVERSGC